MAGSPPWQPHEVWENLPVANIYTRRFHTNPVSCLLMRITSNTEPAWQQLRELPLRGSLSYSPAQPKWHLECTALLWVTCQPGVSSPPPPDSVRKASGFRMLDTATLRTQEQWHFRPEEGVLGPAPKLPGAQIWAGCQGHDEEARGWPYLQGHGQVAGFGVPDDACVHGRLDAPPPLQVAHGVLVQVPSQDSGEARPDAPGRELQRTVGRHKAGAGAGRKVLDDAGSQLFPAPSSLLRHCSQDAHYPWPAPGTESGEPSLYHKRETEGDSVESSCCRPADLHPHPTHSHFSPQRGTDNCSQPGSRPTASQNRLGSCTPASPRV